MAFNKNLFTSFYTTEVYIGSLQTACNRSHGFSFYFLKRATYHEVSTPKETSFRLFVYIYVNTSLHLSSLKLPYLLPNIQTKRMDPIRARMIRFRMDMKGLKKRVPYFRGSSKKVIYK